MDELAQQERYPSSGSTNSTRGLSGTPARQSEVQGEMESLRRTEAILSKIVEELFTTFASVVSPREQVEPGANVIEKEPGVSSPHASNLRDIRVAFEKTIKQLRFLIESSEL